MKLPSGNKLFEYEGGEKNFKECLKTIRERGLNGYLVITSSEGDSLVTGEVVFSKGNPALAEVVVGDETISSDPSLAHLIKHAIDPASKMEFREIVAVDPLLDLLEDKRLKEKASLNEVLKKVKEEERKRVQEEKRRRDLLDELKKIAESGFALPALAELKGAPLGEVEEYHRRIKEVLKRYEEISGDLLKVEEPSLKEMKKEIIELLKEPEKHKEVEEKYKKFRERVQELNEKRKKLEKWIGEWKKQGYETQVLEEKLRKNLEEASTLFVEYIDRLQKAKELEEHLKELAGDEKFQPFLTEVEMLKRRLKDLSTVEESSAALEDLKKMAEADFAQKAEVRKKIDELSMLGLDVNYARELLKKRWDEIKELWMQYEKNANLLISLKKKMEDVKEEAARDLKELWEKTYGAMTKPEDLEAIQKAFQEFMETLKEVQKERSAIYDDIEKIEKKGYVLAGLVPGEDTTLNELKKAHEKIKELRGRSDAVLQELEKMDLRFFPDRGEEIRKVARNLPEVEKAEKSLEKLKKEVEEDRRFREEIEAELSRWEQEGYNVERVLQALTAPHDVLKESYDDFKKRLSAAVEFLRVLEDLDTTYFQNEVETIKDLVKDLYSMGDAKEALDSLKEKLKAFAEDREELSDTLKSLEKEGWDVSGFRPILSGSPEEVKNARQEVLKNKEIAEELLKEMEEWDPLESGHMKGMVEDLRRSLKNLKELEAARQKMSELAERINKASQRRSEIRARVDEWREAGYIVDLLDKYLDAPLEELEKAFSDMEERINKLEQLQMVLDHLDTSHFKDEIEDLIFMNDPSRVEEFSKKIEELKEKIEKDRRRREEIRRELDGLYREGFGRAKEVIEKYLGEDLSILEMHYKDFMNDVNQLKDLMAKTGFRGPVRQVSQSWGIPPSEEYTLENFIVDESNLMATEGVKSALEGEVTLLYLFGPSGTGKTHLLNAAATELRGRGKNVVITSGERFVEDFLNAVKTDMLDEFREFHRRVDALLVDDVEFLAGKETSQEEFFHLLENLKSGGTVILTSDRAPGELPETAEKLINRFQSGVVAEIEPPTEDLKRTFIAEWVKGGLNLKEEQIEKLLEVDNLMTLKGILNTLKRMASGEEVTDSLLLEVLGKGTGPEEVSDDVLQAMSSLKEKVESLAGGELGEAVEEATEGEEGGGEEEEEAEVMVKCSVCGAIIPESATTCPYCGTVFEETEEVLICPYCNSEIPPDSEVCPVCGNNLT